MISIGYACTRLKRVQIGYKKSVVSAGNLNGKAEKFAHLFLMKNNILIIDDLKGKKKHRFFTKRGGQKNQQFVCVSPPSQA